jgi:hypothetical protein
MALRKHLRHGQTIQRVSGNFDHLTTHGQELGPGQDFDHWLVPGPGLAGMVYQLVSSTRSHIWVSWEGPTRAGSTAGRPLPGQAGTGVAPCCPSDSEHRVPGQCHGGPAIGVTVCGDEAILAAGPRGFQK